MKVVLFPPFFIALESSFLLRSLALAAFLVAQFNDRISITTPNDSMMLQPIACPTTSLPH